MKIDLTETEFSFSWEGDGMRPGDNIREHSWRGQSVKIELTPEETKNIFLLAAVEEFDRCQPLSTTPREVEEKIVARAERLAWAAAWATFTQPQPGGWRVGTDCAPKDRPEVYDDLGNYMMMVPRSVTPGDFAALREILDETEFD